MASTIRTLGTDTGSGPSDAPWRVVMMTRGVRYVLPPRRVAHQRTIGLSIAGVCLGVIALGLVLTRGLWWPPLNAVLAGGPPSLDLAMLLIPLVIAAVTARGVRFGVLIAFGHSEIEVNNRTIAGTSRFGPIRRRKAVRTETIERIIVEPGLGDRADKPDDALGRGLANLVVDRTHDEPRERKVGLTHAYPRPLIDALAAEIGDRLSLPVVVEEPEDLADRLEQRKKSDRSGGTARVTRPKKASGTLTTTEAGISVTLPPMGFFKGSKGLGSFSLLWIGFITIFSSFWIASIFGKRSSAVDLFPLIICGVFWLVGFGMVYGAARSGRRRGLIDVSGQDLVITRQSIGAPRAEGWSVEEIDRIVVGPSGTEINDRPVLELQVHLSSGHKVGLFPERNDEELRWIAGEIRHALGLESTDGMNDND